VASTGEISMQGLIDAIVSLPAFTEIEHDDLYLLINELLNMEHLQVMEQGGIIIGLEGEKITNNYDFYGVFPTEEVWIIMHDGQKIGHLEEPINVGEQHAAAGRLWVVVGVDYKRLNVFVKPASSKMRYLWPGDRAPGHDRVLKRMQQVLAEDTDYPYLSEKALERLHQARKVAKQFGMDKYNVFDVEKGEIVILPWFGHRNYYTLRNIITHYLKENAGYLQVGGYRPFYITIKSMNKTAATILDELRAVLDNGVDPFRIFNEAKIRSEKKNYEYKVPKYDRYIPNYLLKKQIIMDYVDLGYLKEKIQCFIIT